MQTQQRDQIAHLQDEISNLRAAKAKAEESAAEVTELRRALCDSREEAQTLRMRVTELEAALEAQLRQCGELRDTALAERARREVLEQHLRTLLRDWEARKRELLLKK